MVVSPQHPLNGERLAALSFTRREKKLMLVVVLPDGSPGMVALAATDLLGARSDDAAVRSTTLSVTGVRRLRAMIAMHQARRAPTGKRSPRARSWKVVRHKPRWDPFQAPVRIYSSHSTERSARIACERTRAGAVRDHGKSATTRWRFSVVHDPANLLVDEPDGEDL
jgi:hypothetical protein